MTQMKKTLLLLSSVAFITSCGLGDLERRGGTPAKPDSAESLLAAEGSWNIVEENPASDPADLHKQARKRVDPNSMAPKTFIPEDKVAMANTAPPGQDVNFRLLRVERQVRNLRDDFRKLLPPLSNLIVSDNALDKTISDIQSGDTVEPSAGMRDNSRTAAPAQKKVASADSTSPKVATGASGVKSLRFGEHPGKTRMVLDFSAPVKPQVDIDNNERLMLVQIPDMDWLARAERSLGNHPLIKSYTAQASPGGGSTLALVLKKPVRVVKSSALPPNAQYPNHRYFVDIAAL